MLIAPLHFTSAMDLTPPWNEITQQCESCLLTAKRAARKQGPGEAAQPLLNVTVTSMSGDTVLTDDFARTEVVEAIKQRLRTATTMVRIFDDTRELPGSTSIRNGDRQHLHLMAVTNEIATEPVRKVIIRLLTEVCKSLGETKPPLEENALSMFLTCLNLLREEPFSVRQAAQAYDEAQKFRKECPPTFQSVGQMVSRITQEYLVLLICCGEPSLTEVSFDTALEVAMQQLEPVHREQLNMVRIGICRIGRNRVLFKQNADYVYGRAVTQEDMMDLFPAYEGCSYEDC